jgi:hypothetical protein
VDRRALRNDLGNRSPFRYFRPAQEVCAIRSLWRHRDSLTEMATCHVHHMQKALDQMNLQIHHVISDIMRTTGLAIIDEILKGERDTEKLSRLRDPRVRASHETIAKSLVGDYRPEHLFTLRQSVDLYRESCKPSWRSSDRTCRNSVALVRSVPGWVCARTTISAAGKYCGAAPEK